MEETADAVSNQYFIQVDSLSEGIEGSPLHQLNEVFENDEVEENDHNTFSEKEIKNDSDNVVDCNELDNKTIGDKHNQDNNQSSPACKNAFPVDSDTVVIINDVKCVLRHDANTKRLMAIPFKNNSDHDSCSDQDDDNEEYETDVSDRAIASDVTTAAEGLLGLQNIGVEGVKRSCRLSKKSKKFWLINPNSDGKSNEESEILLRDIKTDSSSSKTFSKQTKIKVEILKKPLEPKKNTSKQIFELPKSSKLTHLAVQNYLAGLGMPVKRGRGRPRKNVPNERILPPMITTTDGKTYMISPETETINDELAKKSTILCDNEPSQVNEVRIESVEMDDILQTKPKTALIGLKTDASQLTKFKCAKCDFQAFYTQHYQQHLSTHVDETFKCKCCSFLSFDEIELTEHFKETHPKNYCPICGMQVEFAYIMKRHMQRHDPNGIVCNICGKTYKDQYILKMHNKMVHEVPQEIYSCLTCERKFTRKAHLKRHERTHDSLKRYKCNFCDYRGSERSDISKHTVIHQEPKYKCGTCGKLFRHMKNKDLHEKRHRGQRDYKCGMCDFYGYTFTDIRKHIERKHTEKAYFCDTCNQAFRSQFSLQQHIDGGCDEHLDMIAVPPDEIVNSSGLHTSIDNSDQPSSILTGNSTTLDDGTDIVLEETQSADLVMATD